MLVPLVLAGCGGGGGGQQTTDGPVPAGLQVARQTGCLACHKIGDEGNDGPGADLSRIGAKLSEGEIARALVASDQPMPSYTDLPRPDRDAIVKYLASLR